MLVVIVVEVETLTNEILIKLVIPFWSSCFSTYQAMKMMHALDIDDKATTMFGVDLNVSISETTGNAFFIRNNTGSVCKGLVNVEQGREKNALTIYAQRLPCLIHFLRAILAK